MKFLIYVTPIATALIAFVCVCGFLGLSKDLSDIKKVLNELKDIKFHIENIDSELTELSGNLDVKK